MSKGREGYEFNLGLKKYALERANYRCEMCGRKGTRQNPLEVHHRVAIWFAKQYPFIAPAVITHIANAQVLCHECHTQHHQEATAETYQRELELVLQDYAAAVIHMLDTITKTEG